MNALRARQPELDGLRGLAILLVLAFHFLFLPQIYGLPYTLPSDSPWTWPVRILDSGWIGVDLFFVLSGFLITRLLEDADWKSFYLRRALRIFPLYFLLLTALMLVPWPFGIPVNKSDWAAASLFTYTANFVLATEGWDAFSPMFGHLWTLAIEEQFYLVWPVLLFCLPRPRAWQVCLVFLILAPIMRALSTLVENDMMGYVLTPARMDGFAAGGLLSVSLSRFGREKVGRFCRIALIMSATLLVGTFAWKAPFRSEDRFILIFGLSLFAFFFASLLGVLLTSWRPLRHLFCWAPLRGLGRISYGVYLVHQPVVMWLMFNGTLPLVLGYFEVQGVAALFVTFVLCGGVSIGLASAAFLLIEQPIARWKDRHFPYSGLMSNTNNEPNRATG